jgi:hypothetical protein
MERLCKEQVIGGIGSADDHVRRSKFTDGSGFFQSISDGLHDGAGHCSKLIEIVYENW